MGRVRAISESEKRERRQEILNAAGRLLLKQGYRDITVARIAQVAGLAKGTIFLYFQTKEDIFLSLVQDAMENWQLRLQEAMSTRARKGNITSASDLVRTVTSSFNDGLIVKLFAMVDTLEQNIDKRRALQFKSSLKTVLTYCGALIEGSLSGMARGDGVKLLSGLFVCLVGSYKASNQSETAKEIARQPGMEMFRMDFEVVLEHVATCYVSGFLSAERKRGCQ